MIIPDDQPPSPIRSSRSIQTVINKLHNKHELHEYVEQLTAFHAPHLSDITEEIKGRLMLQGLDEDDIYDIHEFLLVKYDGDLMKAENHDQTKAKAEELYKMINI